METTVVVVGCPECGTVARAKDRRVLINNRAHSSVTICPRSDGARSQLDRSIEEALQLDLLGK